MPPPRRVAGDIIGELARFAARPPGVGAEPQLNSGRHRRPHLDAPAEPVGRHLVLEQHAGRDRSAPDRGWRCCSAGRAIASNRARSTASSPRRPAAAMHRRHWFGPALKSVPRVRQSWNADEVRLQFGRAGRAERPTARGCSIRRRARACRRARASPRVIGTKPSPRSNRPDRLSTPPPSVDALASARLDRVRGCPQSSSPRSAGIGRGWSSRSSRRALPVRWRRCRRRARRGCRRGSRDRRPAS